MQTKAKTQDTTVTQSYRNPSYVLVTPARNEEAFIRKTIQSVVSQTILPRKWIIVSDGSTDTTEEIVKEYLENYPWMELVSIPDHRERSFAAKVQCFNTGYEKIKESDFDIIGNLDADISFDEDYFEFLVGKFAEDSMLGVAGTPFLEGSSHYDYRFTNIEHVSGACQLFRRQCFEEIGGYAPIKGGGIDWAAVTTARMRGWKTKTYLDKACFHHRKIGTGKGGSLGAHFRNGLKDYYLGGHPLWEIFRSFFQMKKRPYVLGGLLLLSGYMWAFMSQIERPISQELIAFHRTEQLQRLRRIITRSYKPGS
jgi:poly-beta-1,6-N-acetyl-D-glucosamine synthase